MGWGKREIEYLLLHCHHQNDTFIEIGSDESHFNELLIVQDKVTGHCCWLLLLLLLKFCFTSTETVGLLGTGAQDVHLDFHIAPEV